MALTNGWCFNAKRNDNLHSWCWLFEERWSSASDRIHTVVSESDKAQIGIEPLSYADIGEVY
jgi:hypothetical protein